MANKKTILHKKKRLFSFNNVIVICYILTFVNFFTNLFQMKEFTNTLHKTLEVKGKELNQFRETYGLQIRADVGSEKKEEATSKRSERQPNILAGV